jgi:dipeptidyl aminopeptidase/acylaminoacyl peptidase
LAASFAASAAAAGAFGFSDLRQIVEVREAQISPDGSRVAFVLARHDYVKDRTRTQLMLVDVRTHAVRPLTYERRGIGTPRWSPDGRMLAFTAIGGEGDDANAQVFVLRMDGGDARQLTTAKDDVTAFAWSPDGARIAYLVPDEDNSPQVESKPIAFQVADNNYLVDSATPPWHVWIADVSSGRSIRLTAGAWSADTDQGGGTISWSADGRSIAITRFPTPFTGDSLGSTTAIVDVASGARRQLTTYAGLETAPAFAPQGDRIAYERNAGGNAVNGDALFVTTARGGNGIDVHRGIERNVDDYAWSADGRALYVMGSDGHNAALWYRPLDAPPQRVRTGAIQPEALGGAAKNGALALVASTSSQPAEVYLLPSPSGAPVRLTNFNAGVARASLGRVTGVDWVGPNGFAEDGVLTYPPGWKGGKAPLVLLIHGGPQGASTYAWSTNRQLFASHGYLVFEPNYRGSTNHGDAYQRAISGDAGDGPGKDVMAGVAAVERLGIVDTSRMAVSGWSYGGFMTSWLIGHYHVWKTAVTGASLDDWFDDFNVSFYVYTDVPFFGGVPANPKYAQEWRSQSPLTYAAQITTPTLILGDIGDDNVTITNSFKLYHALKDNNVPVTFVAYPVPGHHPPDPIRNEDIAKRWLAWLDRYLK